MSRVRMRESNAHHPTEETSGSPVPPKLMISGLVVTKAALIEALRTFVPGLRDVQVDTEGEVFYLFLGDDVPGGNPPGP